MIKIIKRKAPGVEDSPSEPLRRQTVTETVTDWIKASRQNRLDQENRSRKKIAGWAAETKI